MNAVFLDRDGTLIEERNYLRDPAQVTVIPGAAEGLRRLRTAGFGLFVVSNQSGVGRGFLAMDDVNRVNDHLCAKLAEVGVVFEKIYVAPEAPGVSSRGRKPSPQFLFDARDEFGIDLAHSYMVGDKAIDLECGWNAGLARSLLVRTGYGAEVERAHPDLVKRATVVPNLAAAADWILHQ